MNTIQLKFYKLKDSDDIACIYYKFCEFCWLIIRGGYTIGNMTQKQ